MTRHILTTATLVAFLAAGQASVTAGERRPNPTSPTSAWSEARPAGRVIALGDHFLGVHVAPGAGALAVAVQLETGLCADDLRLWFGRKNGFGSTPAGLVPVAGLAGYHHALVPLPVASVPGARLWLAWERPDRRPLLTPVEFA